MISNESYKSPDGLLTFEVTHDPAEGVTLGFKDFPWHTHADLLIGPYGPSADMALERFIRGVLNSKLTIAIYRSGNEIIDICITDDPAADIRYAPADQTVEFRYWDGSAWLQPTGIR